MLNNKNFTNEENQPSEQVSRRSFLGKGILGLGAMALTGNAFGQTKNAIEPKISETIFTLCRLSVSR